MADTVLQPKGTDVKTDTEVQLTGAQLQQMLDAHCQDMKAGMPGFLFYGILSSTDGSILSKASANEEASRIIEQGSAFHLTIVDQVKKVVDGNGLGKLELDYILIETDKITFMLMISALGKFFSITALDRPKSNIGISRALLYKCKREFGTLLDDFFSIFTKNYKSTKQEISVLCFFISIK